MRKRLRITAGVGPSDGGPIERIRQQAPFHTAAGIEEHAVSLDPRSAPWVRYFSLRLFACAGPMAAAGGWCAPWRHYGFRPAFVPWHKTHVRDYDVVMVHSLRNFPTLGPRLALPGAGVPYFVFIHGMCDAWFKRSFSVKGTVKQAFWWFNDGPPVNNASYVLFTSEDEKHLAQRSFEPYRAKERVVAYGASDPGPLARRRKRRSASVCRSCAGPIYSNSIASLLRRDAAWSSMPSPRCSARATTWTW